MRALICGGRHFTDYKWLAEVLDSFENAQGQHITSIIHGDAPGADSLAGKWARERNVPCMAFPADWAKFGHNAGPMRNAQMLAEGAPDVVIAFPGGAGTADMLAKAGIAGIQVVKL